MPSSFQKLALPLITNPFCMNIWTCARITIHKRCKWTEESEKT